MAARRLGSSFLRINSRCFVDPHHRLLANAGRVAIPVDVAVGAMTDLDEISGSYITNSLRYGTTRTLGDATTRTIARCVGSDAADSIRLLAVLRLCSVVSDTNS